MERDEACPGGTPTTSACPSLPLPTNRLSSQETCRPFRSVLPCPCLQNVEEGHCVKEMPPITVTNEAFLLPCPSREQNFPSSAGVGHGRGRMWMVVTRNGEERRVSQMPIMPATECETPRASLEIECLPALS